MQVTSNQLSDIKDTSSLSKQLTKVAICAATYKRPHLLRELLESLSQLTFNRIQAPIVEVIIVDNDSAGSGRSVVEEMQASFPWPLKYVVETSPGVTYARNRCVSEAADDRDFIAMLDDDETATPQWLEELLLTQQKFNADIVAGPVIPVYKEDQEIPAWVKAGDFHSYERHETGKKLETAFTGNVMFSTQITKNIKEGETFFDHRFAQKGAEDAYLFACLNKQGYQITWCDEAVLYEPVADNRLSVNWIIKRGFWSWSTHSLIESELYPSFKLQAIRALKGLGLIVIGAATIVPAFVLGKARVVWSLLRIYRGVGTLSGLLGRQGDWQ